jgi:hypothetical protein
MLSSTKAASGRRQHPRICGVPTITDKEAINISFNHDLGQRTPPEEWVNTKNKTNGKKVGLFYERLNQHIKARQHYVDITTNNEAYDFNEEDPEKFFITSNQTEKKTKKTQKKTEEKTEEKKTKKPKPCRGFPQPWRETVKAIVTRYGDMQAFRNAGWRYVANFVPEYGSFVYWFYPPQPSGETKARKRVKLTEFLKAMASDDTTWTCGEGTKEPPDNDGTQGVEGGGGSKRKRGTERVGFELVKGLINKIGE